MLNLLQALDAFDACNRLQHSYYLEALSNDAYLSIQFLLKSLHRLSY